jgi:hypothetical protein
MGMDVEGSELTLGGGRFGLYFLGILNRRFTLD